eukprot:2357634-Prymnesium_polylepis.1
MLSLYSLCSDLCAIAPQAVDLIPNVMEPPHWQVTLDSSKTQSIFTDIQTRSDVGDTSGVVSLVNSLATTLNVISTTSSTTQTQSTNSSANQTVLTPQQEAAQRTAHRATMMATLKSLSLDGVKPLAKQQRAASMQAVLSSPSELTPSTMDDATDSIDALIASSGTDIAPGTPEKLLGCIGYALIGSQSQAQ